MCIKALSQLCLLLVTALTLLSTSARGTFISLWPRVLRTPETAFERLSSLGYPWSPKYTNYDYLHYEALRLHYIDEGPEDASETLLLLHGTPAWSYLFREMIPTLLAKGYRVVTFDFIGCGRSDKIAVREEYTHQLHVDAVKKIVDHLNLKDVTLVGHDLGGPIGGSAVVDRPDIFKRLVFLNTWLPQGDILSSFSRFLDYIPFLGIRLMTIALGYSQSVAGIFLATSDVTIPEVVGGYKAPFPDKRYQGGIAAWPLMIPLKPSDPMAVEMMRVAKFMEDSKWTGPVMVGYSDGERITVAGKEFLESVFPSSCKVLIPNAGHYLMEDQGPLVAETIADFIDGNCNPSG